MTKQEKQNNVKGILRHIDSIYRDMGEFLGKLKKTDKVELFELDAMVTFTGHVHPRIEDGEESEVEFSLTTEDGIAVDFSVWGLILDRTYFDDKNNVLSLVVESVE